MVEVADPNPIRRKRKAISALIPYAVYLARDKQEARMVDTFLRVAAASKPNSGEFIWHHIEPWITTLLDKPTTPSLNSVIMLASPHVDWHSDLDKTVVTKWAVIASATPYTEEVGQSVVDVLLQIASFDSLRQHIPGGIWEWLGKRPSLPPKCKGRSKGTKGGVVRHVRTRDVEILKSYLLLVWSEWNSVHNMGRIEMGISIKEDFNGIGMWSDRKDLTKRLHHVLEELDQTLQQHKPDVKPDVNGGIIRLAKQQYEELEGVILDVDEKAMKPLARTPPSQVDPFQSIDTVADIQNPTQPSRVLYRFHVCDSTLGKYSSTSIQPPRLHRNQFLSPLSGFLSTLSFRITQTCPGARTLSGLSRWTIGR